MAKMSTAEFLAAARDQNGWDLGAASASYPKMVSSARRLWAAFVNDIVNYTPVLGDNYVREWLFKTYPGKNDNGFWVASLLAEAWFYSDKARAFGDQTCTALYPVLHDLGSSNVPAAAGSKVKLVGPVVPSVIAVLEKALVLASRIAPGEIGFPKGFSGNPISVIARENVTFARAIKVKRGFASVPGVQMTVAEGGDVGTMTLFWNDLFPTDLTKKMTRDLSW